MAFDGVRLVQGVRPLDVGIASGLFAFGIVDLMTSDLYSVGPQLFAAMTLQTVPLLWRCGNIGLAISLSLMGVALESGVRGDFDPGFYGALGFVVLVHGLARWGTGATLRLGLAMLLVGSLLRFLPQAGGGGAVIGNVVGALLLGGLAWVVGRYGRRAALGERETELAAAAAVEAERARISRELHDIVGHALAGISLTAGAAQRTATSPDQSEALGLIRNLSHDAAADVRRLVGLLREDLDGSGLAPQPTLDRLPDLMAAARVTGTDARLEVEGEPRETSAGLQLAAYRVVQEGMTNAMRHAAGAPVVVLVEWGGATLAVSVTNGPGGTHGAEVEGPGHGLVGLSERVDLYDGALTSGPVAEGFRIIAEFPLGATP